jgi:hypothetical protein
MCARTIVAPAHGTLSCINFLTSNIINIYPSQYPFTGLGMEILQKTAAPNSTFGFSRAAVTMRLGNSSWIDTRFPSGNSDPAACRQGSAVWLDLQNKQEGRYISK